MREKLQIDIRRVSIILLMMMLVASMFMTGMSHAALTAGKSGKTTWVYMGSGKDGKAYKSTNTNNKQPKYTVKVGGTSYVGYCIDPDKGWGTGTTMTSRTFDKSKALKNYSKAKQEMLSYALLYGYNSGKSAPYGNSNDYYAATQALIWQILKGDVVMDGSGKWTKNNTSDKPYKLIKGHSYGIKCYDWIKKQMSNHVKAASFTYGTSAAAGAKPNKMKYNYKSKAWQIQLTDKNATGYLKQTAATSGLKMARSGYKYIFTASKEGSFTSTLMNDKNYGTKQSAMVFDSGKSSIQSVALGATDTKKLYAAFVTEKPGKGQIIKVDTEGNRLSGFSFKVVCDGNGYSETWTTGEDGSIAKDLYPGKYTVTEVLTSQQLKAGWTKAEPKELVVSEGSTSSVEIANERDNTGSIRIIKVASDGGPVSGFKFNVTGLLTNQKKITEEDVLKGAQPSFDDDSYETGEWQLADPEILEMINEDAAEGKTGSYLLKLKADAKLKAGATDKDSDSDVTKPADEGSEDPEKQQGSEEPQENGDGDEPNESGDPEDSEDTEESEEQATGVTVKGNDEPENTDAPKEHEETKPAEITLQARVTVTMKAVSDAPAESIKKTEDKVTSYDFCWNGAADNYSEDFITGDDGIIFINKIAPGKYKIAEVMTDAQEKRYRQPAEAEFTFTGEENEEIEPFVFENIAKQVHVKVIKKCKDGQIRDILFRVTGRTAWGEKLMSMDPETGEMTEGIKVRTDADGIADFGQLAPGKYQVEELELDHEEYMDVAPQNFEITGQEEDGAEITLDFENKRKAELMVSKQDATTGEELPGALLRLTDKDTGELVEEWISSADPHYIGGLEYGRHLMLQEILAPVMITDEARGFKNARGEYVTGYATAETVEIVVGSDKKVVMTDDLTQTVISKQDVADGKELPGAELQLIDPETGEVIHQWISEVEPHMVEGLIEGKSYILRENQAPLGYDIAEEITFTVGEDDHVIMKDELIPGESPDTGDDSGPMLMLALALAAAAAAIIAIAAGSFRRRAR